jgi:hypothetical protein
MGEDKAIASNQRSVTHITVKGKVTLSTGWACLPYTLGCDEMICSQPVHPTKGHSDEKDHPRFNTSEWVRLIDIV